ncbi:MAG: hypothetical protein U0103_06935 [Candidatus Obscuribacterales bacterium]|nr:hypothetical protein [Cyanobacteria bacterium SZAS LIN-5]RTL34748.1 MAG: hypothetical protein EKK48_31015 [Candidatus Melainabacteria bacterium]
MLKHLATALTTLCVCIAIEPTFANEASCGPMHDEITHDALSATFNAANLNLVQRACESQSKPGSEAASETRRHFGDDNFSRALSYMDRQKRLIIDFAASADTNPMDRARALYHLGLLLHTAQDFYSHTNYVEITAERMKGSPIGLRDPYSMDLVDWIKLASTSKPGSAPKPPATKSTLQSSPEIYKDDPNSAESKIACGSSNYYKVAKELAIKETMRQWKSVEALIKLKHAAKANAILSSMKESSCPVIQDLDKFPEDEI